MGRESILKSIKANKPALLPLPDIDLSFFAEDEDLLETFKKNVQLVGGNAIALNHKVDLDSEIKKRYPKAEKIVALVEESSLGTVSIAKETNPHTLKNVDLAIIRGELGIAENGAVWISEDQFSIRALPFITNDLVIVLSKKNLCQHMHHAYNLIAARARTFGLFISGPSKTADIEQCLVIGAQGAMSLTIFLINE